MTCLLFVSPFAIQETSWASFPVGPALPVLLHSTPRCSSRWHSVFSCLHYQRVNSQRAGLVTRSPLCWSSRYNCAKEEGRVWICQLNLKTLCQNETGDSKEMGAEVNITLESRFKRQRIKYMGNVYGMESESNSFSSPAPAWVFEYIECNVVQWEDCG